MRKLSPLRERLETFEADTTIAPGLDARHVAGHAPGSTMFVVSSGSECALLLDDIAHSPVELTDPAWEAVFDVDPVAAKQVRAKLIDSGGK